MYLPGCSLGIVHQQLKTVVTCHKIELGRLCFQILRKPDGGSRGFGFVTYKDEMSVEKCLVMQHSLSGKTVELKRAVKKEEMGGGGGGMGGMGMGGGGGYGMGGGSGV